MPPDTAKVTELEESGPDGKVQACHHHQDYQGQTPEDAVKPV